MPMGKSALSTRAAVIGSGFGGLAAAVRLQTAGIDVTVFEKRDRPGGRAYVYEDEGFIFDAGPTVITAPHVFEELFAEAGRDLNDYAKLIPVDPFYRLVWEDGDAFHYNGDTDSMVAQIRERDPRDVGGYLAFTEFARRVFHAGYRELAATPFLRFTDMLKVAPALIRLRADRSVYGTVSRFVKNDHVRQALSFHSLLVGGNPFDTSCIYTLIHYLEREWGVYFPRGGTGALVRAMVRLLEELGGEIRLETPVKRIDIDQRNGQAVHLVTTDQKEREPFGLVVSNADIHHTYAYLLRSVSQAEKMRRRLEKMDWSMSLFVLYFGTDRRYTGEIEHHTILFGPRYKELLDDIFHGDQLPDDFSLYLHAPTITDPSLAPPGCEAFYVLSPVPHLGRAPLDWGGIAEDYADRILAYLERHLPGLRGHIVTKRWFTPADFRSVFHTYQGSAFSCAPKLTQSAYFRPHNRDNRIPGLYIVGAGTHPGAGVPGVMNSAKATARLVLEDFAA
ncbi:MAG: phytoene desaturase [Candidatus Latescibacterota bacterium]|nr:MAG: phytoene desaturase [Candidatus Latescibacterota bacterium]